THLVLVDQSFAPQQLDVAMVARAFADSAAAQLVNAAVADVSPIRAAVLDEAYGAGCSRLVIHGDALSELDDVRMREGEGDREEALRVEHEVTLVREALLQRRDGHLGR